MLDAPEEEVRLQGLRELAKGEVENRLQAVFHAMGDESWRVRKEAIALFLSLPTAGRLAGQVVELLHAEENAGLRNAAFEILVRLGRQSLPFLLEELNCGDHDVRKFVLDILGEIADESTIPVVMSKLTDPDENVCAAAAENLGKLRATEAVPALLDALSLPHLLLRFSALEALSLIGSPVPISRLVSLYEDKLLRKPLFDCLGRIGNCEAAELLVTGLSDPMRNVRTAAAQALLNLVDRCGDELAEGLSLSLQHNETVTFLIGMLDSTGMATRLAAVKLLGMARDPRAALPLLELFDDETLRDDAARALIASGRLTVCPLLNVWPSAGLQTRIYLTYVFAETGCMDAAPLLATALDEPDTQLRIVALHALGRLGGAGHLLAICRYIGDDSDEVRNAAQEALAGIGRKDPDAVINLLRNFTGDESPDVRCSAVQVLGRLGGEDVEPLLMLALKDESSQVRRAAIRFMHGRSAGYLQALTLALTDEESEVRCQAVESLGQSHDPKVLPALALALSDDDIWVRTAAVRALGRSGCREGLEFVRRGLRDPIGLVTIAALETLVEHDPTGAADALFDALSHTDDEVVVAALRLLGMQETFQWLAPWGERLLNHHHWDVRLTAARMMAEQLGSSCLPLLEARLLVEGEEMVRAQFLELVEALAGYRE